MVTELGDGGVDEKCWVGAAGTAPDDVWGFFVVLGCGFGDYSLAFG